MSMERDEARAAVAQQSPTTAVVAVRGSVIVASLYGLKQLAQYERYLQRLDPKRREEVVFCLASSWVPVELALAHYAAHDALELSSAELSSMCELVAERMACAFLGPVLRGSRVEARGGSPWAALREYRRTWERLMEGGTVALRELGEKEAVFEIRGAPMLRSSAFRQTVLALSRRALGAFALRTFVRELSWSGDSEEIRILLRWL
jgi:hypothetical protein